MNVPSRLSSTVSELELDSDEYDPGISLLLMEHPHNVTTIANAKAEAGVLSDMDRAPRC